jgi:hypothetical protein
MARSARRPDVREMLGSLLDAQTAFGVPLTLVEKTSKYLFGSYTSQPWVIHEI